MKLDLSLEFRGKAQFGHMIEEILSIQIFFKALKPNKITSGGMEREKSAPRAELWSLPTFKSLGEEEANTGDRENIAREGRRPSESCICEVRLDQF